ncbi:family 20 glycosylhydrolase [Sphingobacterium hungaricum]
MKITISIALLLFLGIATGKASNLDTLSLQVSWQPIENNYLGKEQALSVITIKNSSNQALTATGWKLYFNFIRIMSANDERPAFDVTHVNGDLFYFKANANFSGLAIGEEVRYELISNSWLVNLNDSPQGFYLVWDDGRIQPLPKVKILPPVDEKKFYRVGGDAEESAEHIFKQNATIQQAGTSVKKIFPSPVEYQEHKGSFKISKATGIQFDAIFQKEVGLLQTELSALLGNSLPIHVSSQKAKNSIHFVSSPDLGKEAYRLEVKKEGITIEASAGAGAFYAIQSLKTLIDPAAYATERQTAIQIPCVSIYDEPRFGRRAFMLDVARNFQTKDQIKKLLDVMALYKLNTLHFHLNDDEGWRLEILALPELTSVGSQRGHLSGTDRSHLPASYGSGPVTGEHSGSGYYSRKDFIELLAYATARHIQIIPEIETPGHARAAIKSMQARHDRLLSEGKPEEARKYLLRDTSDRSVYRSVQKWNDNVMDVSMPSVYNFLEVVTEDIVSIYKEAGAYLETIHFGGDEVPQGVWEQSPSVERLLATDASVKSKDQLWDYFFNKVYHILAKHDLYLSGWEEVGLYKVTDANGKKSWGPNKAFNDRNIHLNVWNNLLGNEDLAYRLANAGYKVVLSFVNNFYMDMSYYKRFDEPGFYWGGFIGLDKPFSFIPYDYLKNQQKNYLGRQLSPKVLQESAKLTEAGKKNIVGIQALLWSETIKTPESMEFMVFPRVLAFAEKAWAKEAGWETQLDSLKADQAYRKSLGEFYAVLGKQELKRLDNYHGGFAYRIPSPGLAVIDGQVHANLELPGFTIRYTTDGTLPTAQSAVYSKPIPFKEGLQFSAFNEQGRSSQVSLVHSDN